MPTLQKMEISSGIRQVPSRRLMVWMHAGHSRPEAGLHANSGTAPDNVGTAPRFNSVRALILITWFDRYACPSRCSERPFLG